MIATTLAIWAAALIGFVAGAIYRSVTSMACDCLREECPCNREPNRLGRQVQGVDFHEVHNG